MPQLCRGSVLQFLGSQESRLQDEETVWIDKLLEMVQTVATFYYLQARMTRKRSAGLIHKHFMFSPHFGYGKYKSLQATSRYSRKCAPFLMFDGLLLPDDLSKRFF